MNQDIGSQIINYLRRNTTKICILYQDKQITGRDLLKGANNYKQVLSQHQDKKTFLPLVSSLDQKIYAFLGALIANKAISLVDSELNLFNKISLIKKKPPDIIIKDDSWKMNLISKLFSPVVVLPRDDLKEGINYQPPTDDFDQMLTYSSGSTGEPKLIKRSRFFLNHQFNSLTKLFLKIIGDNPGCILTNQINIIFILVNLGHQVILYSPEMKTKLPTEVDTVIGSTYLMEIILENQISCNNIILGGSPLYTRMIKRLKALYPFSNLYNVYGCTECEPISYYFVRDCPSEAIGTCVGKPLNNILIDSSTKEILVSGVNVNPQAPNLITRLGVKYLATGDAGYLSPDGNLYLLGRLEWKSQQWNIPMEDKLLTQFPQLKKTFFINGIIYASTDRPNSKLKASIRDITNCGVILKKKLPVEKRHYSKPNTHKLLLKWIKSNTIIAWCYFFIKRVPILVYYFISLGSVNLYQNFVGNSLIQKSTIIKMLVFLSVVLRCMDEVKDIQKDKIGNPERPLPQGIITVGALEKFIKIAFWSWIIFSLVALPNIVMKLSSMSLIGFCWMMYKRFWLAKYFDDHLLQEILLDQLFHPFLVFFCLSLFRNFNLKYFIYFSLLNFGTFFSYEVMRKMDPFAAKELGTYLIVYGPKVVLILITLSALSTFIALRGLQLKIISKIIKINLLSFLVSLLCLKMPTWRFDKLLKCFSVVNLFLCIFPNW